MASARKTGVLTFHRCINYGSYWQARCLVQGLRARGEDAVLLDYEDRDATLKEWRCAFQPLLPERTGRSDQHLYGQKARKFLEAFEQLPLSRRFPLQQPGEMEHVDVAVIGSDEVWNLSHPWYGGATAFYGQGLNADRVVSYAASFGNYDAASGLNDYWAGFLRRFDAIAVRDENGRALVRHATGEDPAIVLDPVLQFPPAPPEPDDTRPAYVAVYGHGLPDWLCRQVRDYATARGLRLVSIGYRNDWADEQWLDAGPADFARFMAGAEAVVTNFFHGCVFALVNGKAFACTPSSYRFNKVRDLTAALGAERHLLQAEISADALAALLDAPLEPGIAAAIARMRAQSAAYLDRALA
jgi:hypothetical protein